MSAQKALSKDFEDMVKNYLVNCSTVQNELNTRNTSPELEIRFGTNPKKSKPITSVDYQNVVKQLGMNGWKTYKIEGVQMLRIIPNRIVKEGNVMKDNIQAVVELDNEEEKSKEESKEEEPFAFRTLRCASKRNKFCCPSRTEISMASHFCLKYG